MGSSAEALTATIASNAWAAIAFPYPLRCSRYGIISVDRPDESKLNTTRHFDTTVKVLGDAPGAAERKVDMSQLKAPQLKPHFIQVVHELIDEVEGIYTNIANQALDHIHSK